MTKEMMLGGMNGILPEEVACSEAMRASPLRLANFGSAVAARIPRMTITTISSIRVKPLCMFLLKLVFILLSP